MKRVKDLLSELIDLNFDGVICHVSSSCFNGEFYVERISKKDNGEFLEPSLLIVTGAGSLTLDIDCFVEKLDKPPYKWGYKIIGSDVHNNPIDGNFIEFGKKYTNDELFDMGL